MSDTLMKLAQEWVNNFSKSILDSTDPEWTTCEIFTLPDGKKVSFDIEHLDREERAARYVADHYAEFLLYG